MPGLAGPAGLLALAGLVRSVRTPEFAGVTFHEVLAKSALNRVAGDGVMAGAWTINPYRGCSHACVYCFARRSHEYLHLDAGTDFDREIIVKLNVAEMLRAELRRRREPPSAVALGTNTDPYQRAEGRYRLMPGILEALAEHRVPFSVLTKGTLLRRDLPLIAEASRRVRVDLALSIAVFDEELQRALEPGTPSTAARLATVRAVREAGLGCAVFMMPVLPHLTDSRAQLDAALARVKAAGATSVLYTALHLRPGTKEWFMAWLGREHPELVGRYRSLYPGRNAYAPEGYRRWLAARIRPLIRAHRLEHGAGDPVTGGMRSGRTALPAAAAGAPTLF
ncbi:MAG: Rv2578c family radical SAM protein [Microbacteriaceae bacterium]